MATRKATEKRTRSRKPAAPKSLVVPEPPRSADSLFPIVGVGASAGGLEAFTELLRALPENPGLAFVFVQHQEPKHASLLTQILSRVTLMRVKNIEDGEAIARDTVYVAPPDHQVLVDHGALRLAGGGQTASNPIDVLFRSLAEDQGSRAIAVILSGALSDGSLGARAIKAEGGITFAQDQSARFDTMPRNAAVTGAIDFVLPPAEIAQELVRVARHLYITGSEQVVQLPETEMSRIFAMLKRAHDIDFTHYKPSTIDRRLRRRMAINKVESVEDYSKMLRENAGELEQLYRDLLIHVTSFFRDAEAFEALKSEIAPQIIRDHDNETPVRIWVPGCATGEEVYSIGIAFLEAQSALSSNVPLQIFGTDISEPAIEFARAAVYPASAVAEVPQERLRRFFTKVDDSYRVSKAVRDCCIFARQNLTKDPPFSKLDLISCRNVMIYLGAVLQRKVVSVFHYALHAGGYLLLGSSETVSNFPDVFTLVDRKLKIYQKKSAALRISLEMERAQPRETAERPRMEEPVTVPTNLFREADRVLLARYAPVGVIINENLDVVQFRGRTSAFLEPPSGTASFNLLKMAREGLLAELRSAIQAARKANAPVRRDGIRVKTNGDSILANVEIIPFIAATKDKLLIVLFEEAQPEKRPLLRGRKGKAAPQDERDSPRLKRELEATREYLQSIIEEQEAMNEELRSANEEIQSSNEELQSTNEELETAKEELQSSNEELTTLNEELENRNQELAQANNDLVNLLNAIDVPVVMLDGALRIRRFNPGAQRVLNLSPGDSGRPISDMKTSLVLDNLSEVVARVIDTLEAREMDVADRDGRSYSLRIRPYKTTDNKIDGAVLVLVELRKETAAEAV